MAVHPSVCCTCWRASPVITITPLSSQTEPSRLNEANIFVARALSFVEIYLWKTSSGVFALSYAVVVYETGHRCCLHLSRKMLHFGGSLRATLAKLAPRTVSRFPTHRRHMSKSISELLATMEYGPAPEDDSTMHAWLDAHGRSFGAFIDGEWRQDMQGGTVHTATAPSTGEALCQVHEAGDADADTAIAAARAAQPGWANLSGHARARHMYSIARHLQKHARLLAVVEAMDNGKPIRETRDADVPLTVRHFYHHAGWSQVLDRELPEWKPLGVIAQCVAGNSWRLPWCPLRVSGVLLLSVRCSPHAHIS